MGLVLTRSLPVVEVELTDVPSPELKVRFREKTTERVLLLRDVLAEGDTHLRQTVQPSEDNPQYVFLRFLNDMRIRLEIGRHRAQRNYLSPSYVHAWRATVHDGIPFQFCGRVFVPKDALDALVHLMVCADLVLDDPRVQFWHRMQLLFQQYKQ